MTHTLYDYDIGMSRGLAIKVFYESHRRSLYPCAHSNEWAIIQANLGRESETVNDERDAAEVTTLGTTGVGQEDDEVGESVPLYGGKKLAVLQARAAKMTITGAARAAGVSRQAVYWWKYGDPAYAKALDEAKEEAVDVLLESAYERAFRDPILTMFLIKGARPEYNDKYQAAMAFAKASGTGELAQAILRAAEIIDKLTDGYSPRRRGERSAITIEGTAVPGAGAEGPPQAAIGPAKPGA